MSESTYSVYLVQRHGEQGGQREVTSPVRGHSLEFYDTGVWLDRETGRNFFPYRQIRTIREHPEGEAGAADREPSDLQAGDTGAEEEMLEE
ncbi:hypothetical protein [Halorussus sp. AFM4]|uniref:hypothetical protein n=1 Tax=Halorussus sp. AFM4 TaxID=3421651 RepID=UPI003EBDCC70